MATNKIKLRNLDDEVLHALYSVSKKIGFDQLDSEVVTEIKNKTNTSGSSYNDTELRNRVTNIENTMLSKSSAENTFATKKDYDTSIVVDTKISTAKKDTDSKIANLNNDYIPKEKGSITEDLLSYELQMKVNSHGNSSGGSSTGDSSNVDSLKAIVNRNTNDISSIKTTINTNVFLKSTPISLSNFDDNTRLLINNARQNSTLITENDLSDSLKKKFNQSTDVATQNVINDMYKDSSDGQVLVVKKVQGEDDFTLHPKYIFLTDIFVFTMESKYLDEQIVQKNSDDDSENVTFDSGKTYAKNNGYEYIADLTREILLHYDKTSDSWTEDVSAQNTYDKISGCFIASYPEKIIYFCKKARSVVKVFDPNDYVKAQDIEDNMEYFEDLDSRTKTLENNYTTLSNNKADKATTLAGYSISDAYTKTEIDNSLYNKAAKATTLSGYGITNAYTKNEINSLIPKLVYPIGIIVEFLTSVDPNTVWTRMTWEKITAENTTDTSAKWKRTE